MSCLNRVCIDVRVCVIYYVTIGTVRGHGAQAHTCALDTLSERIYER